MSDSCPLRCRSAQSMSRQPLGDREREGEIVLSRSGERKRGRYTDTNGAEESVIVNEVSSFQRLKCMQEWYLGEKVSCLERCPQFISYQCNKNKQMNTHTAYFLPPELEQFCRCRSLLRSWRCSLSASLHTQGCPCPRPHISQ